MHQTHLQTAFEIKTMCDELSRRLLRWHWEQQEGRTLRQLVEYVAQRTEESPEYYSRMQELSPKTTWPQLDTTVCLRILLDPGEGTGERPLRLLSAAPRPVVARQCCNGLRQARNAAAYAGTLEDTAQAAASFAEAVEKLDDGYGDSIFTDAELEKYRKAAARAINLCRELAINQPDESEPPAARRRASQDGGAAPRAQKQAVAPATKATGRAADSGSSASTAKRAAASGSSAAQKSRASKPAAKTASDRSGRTTSTHTGSAKHSAKRASARRKKKRELGGVEWLFLILGAVVLLAGIWLRGKSMGLFG